MTVIRHNSISGIVSITAATGSNLAFYDSTGSTLSLDTGDINAGVITATTANFTNATISGDLTVNGTTTTLDTTVTEVDRLEVGANNSTVGVAITQSGTGDILRLYDGATEVFSVTDGGDITVGNSGFFYDYSAAKLGVGLDTPGSTRLHVKGHSSLNNSLLIDVNTGDSTLGFAENGTEKWRIENVTSDDALRFYDVTNTSERLRITSSGKIQINNTTPTLEFNGTQQSGTASADLLWNLRDGNSNDYDVVKITGQNSGNGGYGDLTVQTAYNNTLKDRIVVSNTGISSFIGYTANTDVLRVHDGTVQINDSLNQNNWQLQIKNTNNSFATGNSLIRAEYTGTNSSDNIKVFSGYVTSESAETCYIAGNGIFYGRGVSALRDNSVLFGKYESGGGATIDITSLTSNTWRIIEVFGSVNPNSGGSAYVDPLHMYVYNGKGWNGSALTHYIYTQHIAPPARDIFPSGSGSSGNIVDAVWYNGSTESDTCPNNSGSHYVRLKCYNYNATYGSSFNIRYFIRG